ncbi:Uncharacterised protein [Vibrio cholerae]|nr:Uncharacterised protein [Vibrio cholerae]
MQQNRRDIEMVVAKGVAKCDQGFLRCYCAIADGALIYGGLNIGDL